MTNNRKRDQKTDKRPSWAGFLDYRLNDEQLEELDGWSPSALEVWEQVDKLMLDGYRLTLSYSSTNHLATCTIIDDNRARPSAGWALSTADVNAAAALKGAIYKHFLALEGDWTPLLSKPSQGGRRG